MPRIFDYVFIGFALIYVAGAPVLAGVRPTGIDPPLSAFHASVNASAAQSVQVIHRAGSDLGLIVREKVLIYTFLGRAGH
jgi:hypothetical protein